MKTALSSARSRGLTALGLCVFFLLGCDPAPPEAGAAAYRRAIDAELGVGDGPSAPSRLDLPDRAGRRLAVADHRIGPLDFLGIIGCRLSEVVAERNGSLGRVLLPTRRLAYELDLLAALEDCLPSLEGERAAEMTTLLEAKRGELGAHRWNAVWLDEEIERYVARGPAAVLGGDDAADAAIQLRRATEAFTRRDVNALEDAFAQLRDDAPLGPAIDTMRLAHFELAQVTARIGALDVGRCEARERRLIRTFREDYLPLQRALAALDRRSGREVEALAGLYRAAAAVVDPLPSMHDYGRGLLGAESAADGDLVDRLRSAFVDHARAWQPIFERCGVELGSLR